MKKTIILLVVLSMLLCASGCGSAFSAEYYYSEPYVESGDVGEGSGTDIRNASTLKRAILELIYAGESEAQFRFGSYSGSLMDDLATICLEIKTSTPVGAYAVDDISYDTSRIVSYYTADISIRYKKSAEEISDVENLSGLGELGSHLLSAMDSCSTKTVVQIYSSAASGEYIKNFVEESYYSDPFLVAVKPMVSVSVYPDTGPERIYEIYLRYDTLPEQLRKMETEMLNQAEWIAASINEEEPLYMALRLAERLAEHCSGEEPPSAWANTAYGALVEGSNDSYGMAMAYAAVCSKLGVPCMVVRGENRTEGGTGCAWNIIELEGEYYHVDPSRFGADAASAFLLSDEDIWGEYDWDRESYPVCEGSLGPETVFEIPVAQPEETPPAESEEPVPPEDSPDVSEPPEPPEESPVPDAPETTEPVE